MKNKTAEEILEENVSFRDEVKKEFVLRAMKEYAQSVAEDLRERIAFEARLEPNGMLLQVDKQSILDTEIILP